MHDVIRRRSRVSFSIFPKGVCLCAAHKLVACVQSVSFHDQHKWASNYSEARETCEGYEEIRASGVDSFGPISPIYSNTSAHVCSTRESEERYVSMAVRLSLSSSIPRNIYIRTYRQAGRHIHRRQKENREGDGRIVRRQISNAFYCRALGRDVRERYFQPRALVSLLVYPGCRVSRSLVSRARASRRNLIVKSD